jgi:hypothetical protein
MLSGGVFFGCKIAPQCEKKGIQYFIFAKIKKIIKFFGPHVNSDFSLVAFLKLFFNTI